MRRGLLPVDCDLLPVNCSGPMEPQRRDRRRDLEQPDLLSAYRVSAVSIGSTTAVSRACRMESRCLQSNSRPLRARASAGSDWRRGQLHERKAGGQLWRFTNLAPASGVRASSAPLLNTPEVDAMFDLRASGRRSKAVLEHTKRFATYMPPFQFNSSCHLLGPWKSVLILKAENIQQPTSNIEHSENRANNQMPACFPSLATGNNPGQQPWVWRKAWLK